MGPRRFVLLAVIAVAGIAADLATKEVALALLRPGEAVSVVGELFHFTLVFNTGAAFSIGSGMTWVFSLLAFVVVGYILRIARRLHSPGWAVALGLILGGACGNLVDRLFRDPGPLRGAVVDWIQLPHWPVFNIADSCIVVGGVLTVLLAFNGVNIDGTRDRESATTANDGKGKRA